MKHYFYTTGKKTVTQPGYCARVIYEVIEVETDSSCSSDAEELARAYATQLGKTLTGGYNCQKPTGELKILVCPKDIKPEKRPYDLVDFIMDFENGDADEKKVVEHFQKMIDNGTVWQLQGSYGRVAQKLIDKGLCHA